MCYSSVVEKEKSFCQGGALLNKVKLNISPFVRFRISTQGEYLKK